MVRTSSRTGLLWGASALAVGLAVGVGVRAGNVTPPPGPVQGTMHTLDEIYALTAQSVQQGTAGRWKYFYVPNTQSAPVLVASGPGVLHSLLVYGCDCGGFTVYDANSTNVGESPRIADVVHDVSFGIAGDQSSVVIPLDVEFSQGLVIEPPPGASRPRVTVIYRLD